ncbi:MAG: hypothetical protein GF320_05620, partial [Armatimonadia bacterium]|nr:hypothetical protein [Armatimonadia bacterium]
MMVTMQPKRPRGWLGRGVAGFTLVEMLVVLVILIILMGLIFIPLYQSFNATKRAETTTRLQDSASTALARIVQDVEEGMYVYVPPAPTQYADPNMPDAVYLPWLDVARPATDDELHYLRGGSVVPGNPNEVAYPTRPSDRIVRYFTAPLPGHPAGAFMWAEPGPALEGYVNPFIDVYADPGRENLVTLYRAEFSLEEVTAAGAFAWPVPYDALTDPYFYTGQLSTVVVPDPQELGRFWKTVSVPLTDPENMDCAIYQYDPTLDDEAPVTYTPAAGLPGALPGLTMAPSIVPKEAALPSSARETTAYAAEEGLWGDLTRVTIEHVNGDTGAVGAPYTADLAVSSPGGEINIAGVGDRLLPTVNPATGQLTYARRTWDAYFAAGDGSPLAPPGGYDSLQTDNPGGIPTYPHLFRVSYGGLRPVPVNWTTFNERDARFKMVNESEVVRVVNTITGQPVQCRRVEDDPDDPFEYRIDYLTGIIRFDEVNYPDPSVFEIWVQYDYRDNFVWSPNDPKGYVDDSLLVSYVTYREVNV